MKKSILILGALLIVLSTGAFAQKKKHHHYHHGHHISNHHHGFWGGLFAGIIFSEVFESTTYSYRKMYFAYNPYKDTWRLRKNFVKNGPRFYGNEKVIAQFENPSGGRDFIVHLNSRGEWKLNCPKKLVKIFKKKVRKNL